MSSQQKFGQRLEILLNEKGISQGEFAEILHCSRQSINFYILGKRSPDIALAAKMANYLGVSCDYLVGRSNIRQEDDANLTAGQLGLDDETIQFFGGLNLIATGKAALDTKGHEEINTFVRENAQRTLDLLNEIIGHERFGIMLQYIKRYQDLLHGEDIFSTLQHFMIELESSETGNRFGSHTENKQLLLDFCLHIASNYLIEIIKDITCP